MIGSGLTKILLGGFLVVVYFMFSWVRDIYIREKLLTVPNGDKGYDWHSKQIRLFQSYSDKAYYIKTKLGQTTDLVPDQKAKLLTVCTDLASDLRYYPGLSECDKQNAEDLFQKTLKANRVV